MTVSELTRDEQLALVALSEMSLMIDGALTDAEQAQLDDLAHELGDDNFHGLVEEAESRFADRQVLKAFLRTITRPEARELIYGTVLNEALLETLAHDEAQFLEWLRGEWNVSVSIEPAGDAPA